MRSGEFDKVMYDVPCYVVSFHLVKMPAWLVNHKLGDAFYIFSDDWSTCYSKRTGGAYGIGASYLSFIEYKKVSLSNVINRTVPR